MSNRPLILTLITKADVGGAQVHVLEILKRLKSHYRFVLATGEHGYLVERAQDLGIEIIVLKHLNRAISPSEDRRAYAECLAMLRTFKPELLHTHSSKAGVIGRLACRRSQFIHGAWLGVYRRCTRATAGVWISSGVGVMSSNWSCSNRIQL